MDVLWPPMAMAEGQAGEKKVCPAGLPAVKTRERWLNEQRLAFNYSWKVLVCLGGPIVWRQSPRQACGTARPLISCQACKTEEEIRVRLPASESAASMAWRTIPSLHLLQSLWPLPRTPILGKKLAPVWLTEWGKGYAFLIGWDPGIFLGLLWSDISVNITTALIKKVRCDRVIRAVFLRVFVPVSPPVEGSGVSTCWIQGLLGR